MQIVYMLKIDELHYTQEDFSLKSYSYVINHDFKDEHIATNSGTAYASFLFAFTSGLSRFVNYEIDPSCKIL